MKIALLGYGKMGKTIESLVENNNAHQINLKITSTNRNLLTVKSLQECDVAIEFSNPKSVLDNIDLCIKAKTPIIVGTTGWHKDLEAVKLKCINENSGLLYASNFSIGVNLFFKVNAYLAKLMENYNDYSLSIDETHHLSKKDAPSGTAISIANQIIENNSNYKSWKLDATEIDSEIPIQAIRKADVKGKHSIKYKSEIDTIELTHNAFNRNGFALGALLAAEFIIGKTGVYTIQDALQSKFKDLKH